MAGWGLTALPPPARWGERKSANTALAAAVAAGHAPARPSKSSVQNVTLPFPAENLRSGEYAMSQPASMSGANPTLGGVSRTSPATVWRRVQRGPRWDECAMTRPYGLSP